MPSKRRPNSSRSVKGTPVRHHNYSNIRSKKKRTSLAVPIMIMFLLALVISLIVSAAWQKHQDARLSSSSSNHSESSSMPVNLVSSSGNGPASPSSIPSMNPASQTEELLSSAEGVPESSEPSDGDNSSSYESSSSEIPAASSGNYGTPVPVSQQVTTAYFDDALFIGDSITYGIESYGLLNNATVIAHTGINPSTILTSEVYEMPDGESKTLLDAAKDLNPKKIYIMIGANGISWIGKESFINYYRQIIERLKEDHPDSIIYVQSILPVTKAKSDLDPTLANAKINDYNVSIQEMAESLEVYYLNVAEAIKDSTGALPAEASPVDGIHFGPSTYQKWFDYLMTHVVDADSAVSTVTNSSSSSDSPENSGSSESSSIEG